MFNGKLFKNYLLERNEDVIVLSVRDVEGVVGPLARSYGKSYAFTLNGKPFQNACDAAGYRCVSANLENDIIEIKKLW